MLFRKHLKEIVTQITIDHDTYTDEPMSQYTSQQVRETDTLYNHIL